MSIITHKRGVPFSKVCQRLNVLGNPIDIGPSANLTVLSQIRTQKGDLIASCTVSYPSSNTFKLRVAETMNFPLERLHWDIKYINASGDNDVTETIYIDVIKEVTQ